MTKDADLHRWCCSKTNRSPASQVEIIEEAIRLPLALEADAKITTQHRQAVPVLDLGDSDVTNAGLAHLVECQKLKRLRTAGTQITKATLGRFLESRRR